MKTIITSAKTIIKTAKLVPFSGIHTLIGIKSGEGNIFYFPQPDIVFKKDQTEAENMERTKALFYQLFNYGTHTNNLYFIRLEISSLIQEIKLAIDSLTSPVKVSFEKIYKEVLEIENKGGFYKKTDYWNRHIEGLKNDINTLIEKLNVENSGLFNVYLAQTVERYKSERNTFKNLLNSIYTRRKLSVLENSFIKHANYITGILNREQWQKDAYKFYNIYNSMEENERREFLNALSITENEIASVRKMTKEQWKAFLNNILPAVYLFVTNYVNKDNYIEILENNKILKNISSLNQEQWLDFKIKLFNNKNSNFERLISFFKTEQNKVLHENWKAEQRNFINFVYDNKYISELSDAVSVVLADYTEFKMWNDEFFNVHNIKINDVSSKFSDWLSYLTENQWEEMKTVLKANENNKYIRPLLEILKLPSQEKNEPEFSAEKRRFINYINENKKASLEIIETLENKNEIKEELEKWVDLKNVHTLLRNEEKKEIIKSDFSSISLENEDLKWEKTENNVSLEIEDWLSYLTESQWEEVKTVLKANENNQYIRPLLEILKEPKMEGQEPEFSAEKRRFINYINENKKATLEVIGTLENKEEIKRELEKWVSLKDVHALLRNEEKKEIIKSDSSSISLENDDLKWEKTENNVSLEIEDWLSYLTENQWEEVKTVLKDNEDKEYVNPVLEILSGTDFKDAEKLRLFQKEKFIKYINDNKSLADKFMKIVSQNKVLYKSINNWVNKDVNKFDIKKEQINKHSNQVNRNYGFSKLQNLRFSDKTKRFINDWISDIEMREYQYLEKVPVSKTYNVDSHFKNINVWFKQKRYANEIWQRTRTLDNSGITLKNNNLMYKKNYRSWNNMINYSLLNSFENGNNSHIGAVFETYKSGTFTNIENNDINKFSSYNNSLRNTWNFYKPLEKVYGYADNNESSKYINFGYMHFNYKEPLASFSGQKDFQDIYNEKFLNGAYKNYSADAFNINRSSVFGNINKMTLNKGNYDMTANKISYLLTENHNKATENELSQYKIADLVVVRKDYGHTAIDNTPKMPEIQNEVKKAVNSQMNDIITVKHNETEERNGNKEVYELTKRLNLQQKEIEKILTSQKQMLKITDISIVTEKIMNQMQSQLRLEKLRRGL